MKQRFASALLALFTAVTTSVTAHAQTLDEDPTVNGVDNPSSMADGYDVILLAGQSNMYGNGVLVSGEPDGVPDPRIFMWNPASRTIVQAKDPFLHIGHPVPKVGGLGMTLAKAYLKTLPANRKILLVGGAAGGTSFNEFVKEGRAMWDFNTRTFKTVTNLHRRWIPTLDPVVGGDLYRGVVRFSNEAMAAAGPTARFVAIAWHQGESDAVFGGGPTYATNLHNLITAFRSNINGASSRTPVVVGELNPCFMASCPNRTGIRPSVETFNQILEVFHTLRDKVPYTAWVSSAGLSWKSDGTHFDLLSLRELGRRYADKLLEAQYNLPQPEVDLKIYNAKFFNTGTSIDLSPITSRIDGNVTAAGKVSIVQTPERGNVAKIQAQSGWLEASVDGTLFNASYTKMAWVNLASLNYTNNLLSAINSTQRHHLMVTRGRLTAGHGTGSGPIVQAPTLIGTNSWTHVAVTYDASSEQMTLYINGSAVASASNVPAAPAGSGTHQLLFSRYGHNANGYGLDGSMNGNKVYRQALSASQIHALYRFSSLYRGGY